MSVDIVLGPLLTFVVFDPSKTSGQRFRDIAVVVAIQVAAFVYGLLVVADARPVAMVFEQDRITLVTANGVDFAELADALPEFQQLPWRGPWLLATRRTRSVSEHNDAILKSFLGFDLAQRPVFWEAYELHRVRALERSRLVSALVQHYAARAYELRDGLDGLHADPDHDRFLPVKARGDYVAILDAQGNIRGYLPFDGFF